MRALPNWIAVSSVGILLGASTSAWAVPTLQLDVIGGTYDVTTQTVVSGGPSFTLLALATPGNVSETEILNDTYYISAALLPSASQSGSLNAGAFSIGGANVLATDAGMTYGTPPVDAAVNPNLPDHGIFPTYFHEVSLQFSAADTTTTHNTQDDAGGALFDDSGSDTFYAALEIDVSGLVGKTLHFDLYNTKVKNKGTISIDDFAPFSHDAESATPFEGDSTPVSEPLSAVLFLSGIAVVIRARRRNTSPGSSLPH